MTLNQCKCCRCKMDSFQIGDRVVYTPNIEGLRPAIERITDHGVVIGKKHGTHLIIQFDYSESRLIYHESMSHLIPGQSMQPRTTSDLVIPAGSCDIITMDELHEGDIIVDFLRNTEYESHFGAFYSEATFNRITRNPFTAAPIDHATAKRFRAVPKITEPSKGHA